MGICVICLCGGTEYTLDLKSNALMGLRVRIPPQAPYADVMELVYRYDLGSYVSDVWVQIPSSAPLKSFQTSMTPWKDKGVVRRILTSCWCVGIGIQG